MRWSRSTSNFYALIGQSLTGEFTRKIYAASGDLCSSDLFLGNTLFTYSRLPWAGTPESTKGRRIPGAISRGLFKGVYLKISPQLLWATLVILGEYKLPREEPIILLVLTLRFVTLQGKPNQSNHFKFCDLFLYSRHLYFQLTSEKKKKYKMLFYVLGSL